MGLRRRYAALGCLVFGFCLGMPPAQDAAADEPAGELALPPTLVHKPKAGIFLVASRALSDPNFRQTVVLLTDHGDLGSIGLIVNKPTGMTVAAALPDIDALHDNQDLLLLGGPVAINSIRLLVRSGEALADGLNITDDVYLVNSSTILESLLRKKAPGTTINYYAGYAGWAPGQLEMEISRGDWHLVKADSAAIFTTDRDSVWPRLIEFLSGQWVERRAVPSRARAGEIRHPAAEARPRL